MAIFKHRSWSLQNQSEVQSLNSLVNYIILPISFTDVVASVQDKIIGHAIKSPNQHKDCRGAVAQSVERATPGKEVLGLIPLIATPPPPTGWVGVSIMWPSETEVMVSPLSRVWQHIKLSYVSLGTRQRYNLVVDHDAKKPTIRIAIWRHNSDGRPSLKIKQPTKWPCHLKT